MKLFLFSEKGKKTIEGRKPGKHGGKASKAGINDEHVAVFWYQQIGTNNQSLKWHVEVESQPNKLKDGLES
jgi:hypothetical protein